MASVFLLLKISGDITICTRFNYRTFGHDSTLWFVPPPNSGKEKVVQNINKFTFFTKQFHFLLRWMRVCCFSTPPIH